MPNATDLQVQVFSDSRFRPRSESVRDLVALLIEDAAVMTDVLSACTQTTPTWVDNRNDGPPHLLTPANIVGYNTFITDVAAFIQAHAKYPLVQKAIVRPIIK